MKKSIIQEFYAFMIGIEILLDHFASTADGGSQQFLPAHNYDRCKAILHYLAQHESIQLILYEYLSMLGCV